MTDLKEFGNLNEFEVIALQKMLEKGVAKNLIRAFDWAYLTMVSDRLIKVSEAHANGKVGEFDLTNSMQHAKKAVEKLAGCGYTATVRHEGDIGGYTFMTSNYVVQEKGTLLIDPPK